MMPRKIQLRCTVNAIQTFEVFPMERLLDVLRNQLHLTGTKKAAARVSVALARCSSTARLLIAVSCQ